MIKIIFISVAYLSILNCNAGDILTLKTEKIFERKVPKIKDYSIVFEAKGKKNIVFSSLIFSIHLKGKNEAVTTRYMNLVLSDSNKYLNASGDAQKYHVKKGGHFVFGVLFHSSEMIGTTFSILKPDIVKHIYIISKNKELFSEPYYLISKLLEEKSKKKTFNNGSFRMGLLDFNCSSFLVQHQKKQNFDIRLLFGQNYIKIFSIIINL